MKVVVISTGLSAKNRVLCKASVAAQKDVEVEHRYIEASTQVPRKCKLENIYDVMHSLPPEQVVAILDGDDMLANRHALSVVAREHEAGAWVTYGSFRFFNGQKGFASPYETANYRQEPWRATHLKTTRAGLFQRIKKEDLFYDGDWVKIADDHAFMFPMLEMAGPSRVKFLSDILYIYDSSVMWEATATKADLQRQDEIVAHLRALPKYGRVEEL